MDEDVQVAAAVDHGLAGQLCRSSPFGDARTARGG
jgi:hypothetical protein